MKNMKGVEINAKIVCAILNIQTSKIIQQNTNAYVSKKFDEILKKRFAGTYKFPNHDISKFIFMMGKVVYAFEYMDDWKKINETSLPEKKDFYSHLNMEHTSAVDYTHAKKACRNFEIRDLGK